MTIQGLSDEDITTSAAGGPRASVGDDSDDAGPGADTGTDDAGADDSGGTDDAGADDAGATGGDDAGADDS